MTNFLQGKRTYILVFLGMIVWGAKVLGKIDAVTASNLLELLGIGSVGTIRASITQSQQAVVDALPPVL